MYGSKHLKSLLFASKKTQYFNGLFSEGWYIRCQKGVVVFGRLIRMLMVDTSQ